MNGAWYPWGYGVDGNTPRLYREAWHRIHWIFRNHGADNVKWVWSPNEDAGGGHPLAVFYPGDEFVDWVGIDGFCWGGAIGWPSFTAIFASTYDRIVRLTSKPIMIAETGAGEEWGSKAEWIASALGREAPAFPNLRALVWFDAEDPRADFRVNSSPAALAAFRTAVASPRYGGSREELLATPANLPPGSVAPPEPSGGFGAP
jgi:beta-mannanase